MPIEIRRFGVGHRRPEGPAGTAGVEGRVIEARASGSVAELAFSRRARTTPHASPGTTLFIVIEGGGWVGVGDERERVSAGDAVVWPPDVLHAAWTDGWPMRAIVVELADDPRLLTAGVLEGESGSALSPPSRPVSRGDGEIASRPAQRGGADAAGQPRPAQRGGADAAGEPD